MEREFKTYDKLDLGKKRLEEWLSEKKKMAEEMVLNLYKNDIIESKLLYATTGYTENKHNKRCRIAGEKAKYFKNLDPGYAYPLFKTHKLSVKEIDTTDATNIPVRLVQSAGNSYLGRVTALLETMLKPISIRY